MRHLLHNERQTIQLAHQVAKLSDGSDVLCLKGPLGSGKSTVARALIRSACRAPYLNVPSPTYTLVQIYKAPQFDIYHYDLWRLSDPDELEELCWEEARENVAIVEWPEILGDYAPADAIRISLDFVPDHPDYREVTITGGRPSFLEKLHAQLKPIFGDQIDG